MKKAPTLAAYVCSSNPEDCFVWCPACKSWHRHATPWDKVVNRAAHCRNKKAKAKYKNGYDLKIIGEISKVHESFILYDKYKTPPENMDIKIYGELDVE